MKARSNGFWWYLVVGACLAASVSVARAGTESHGGSAVVCFNMEPNASVLNYVDWEGRISPSAAERITSIETLESYLARMTGKKNPQVQALENATYEEAIKGLRSLFKTIPELYYRMRDAREYIGDVGQDGVPSSEGVGRIADTGPLPTLPLNCALVQMVIRRNDVFYYNSVVWSHEKLSPYQRALMQLHEEVYYVGATKFQHTDSMPTQLLITYLLTTNFTEESFYKKAQRYGFDLPLTLSQARAYREELLKAIQEDRLRDNLQWHTNNGDCYRDPNGLTLASGYDPLLIIQKSYGEVFRKKYRQGTKALDEATELLFNVRTPYETAPGKSDVIVCASVHRNYQALKSATATAESYLQDL